MTMRQAIGFVTDKAPGGGYQLAKIVSLEGGITELQVVTYRTTLVEVQEIEHRLKSELFGEAAWIPTSTSFPRPQIPPRQDQPDHDMPKIVSDEQQLARDRAAGLMNRLYDNVNGTARALVPALFLAGVWLSTRLGGLA